MIEVRNQINESINLKYKVLEDEFMLHNLIKSIELIVQTYQQGGKVLFCGNGGSAADAQHLAAELSGRFYLDRPALNAEALHVNSSFLTAMANDYSFDLVYERMISALGQPGDVLVALSTSGSSPNVIHAINKANKLQMNTIGLTGHAGGELNSLCDLVFCVPSDNTPRVQEVHILLGHIICENVERILFSS